MEVTEFNKKIFVYSQKEFLCNLAIKGKAILSVGSRNDKIVVEVQI